MSGSAVYSDAWLTVHVGDNRAILPTLPTESVHCVVTSPPYWGLRDYGTASWDGGDSACDHRIPATGSTQNRGNNNREGKPFADRCGKCGAVRIDRQLGLEPTPEEYVENMVAVFREVRRVLRDDGTVWLNLGDSYAAGKAGRTDHGSDDGTVGLVGNSRGAVAPGPVIPRKPPTGLKPKDLVGIPWRVAFALQADGWYLRSDIIWAKPNPMPESVTDRPTKAHEYLFLLTKSARYHYDADAVKEPFQSSPSDLRKMAESRERIGGLVKEQDDPKMQASGLTNVGRKRSVGDKQAAAAALMDRERSHRVAGLNERWDASEENGTVPKERNRRSVWTIATQPYPGAHFAVMPEALVEPCVLAGCPEGGTVLDPFGGSGTVAVVAQRHRRKAVLIELNPEYAAQAVTRAARQWGKGGRIRRAPKPAPDGSWLAEAAS